MKYYIIVAIMLTSGFAEAVEVQTGVSVKSKQILCTKPEPNLAYNALQKIRIFVKKYKPSVIKHNLSKIVLCKKLSRYGLSWIRGTYLLENKAIFLEIDEHDDTLFVLHHEFSSILMFKHKKINKKEWMSFNKEDYIRDWKKIDMNWQRNSHLQDKGFIFPYSQQSFEDDFNVMAGLYLSDVWNYSQILKVATKCTNINEKFKILKRYYNELIVH